MKTLVLVVLVLGCSPQSVLAPHDDAAVGSVGLGSAGSAAMTPSPVAPANFYATRKRPDATFDLLSPMILPGDNTLEKVSLPASWKVVGPPHLAIDPTTNEMSPFEILGAKTDSGVYTVIARNKSQKPARFVADVPYTK